MLDNFFARKGVYEVSRAHFYCGCAGKHKFDYVLGVRYTAHTHDGDFDGDRFYLVVRDLDGTAASFEIHTDAETVGEALLALELIEGEVGDYGLYIKSVNGITADWDTEQAYWAFYVNGEYAQTGVDTTPVMEGAAYELVKTNS